MNMLRTQEYDSDLSKKYKGRGIVEIKVISLAQATGRRNCIRDHLSELDIPWSFLDAFTEVDPRLNLMRGAWNRCNGRELNAGELGCYSSHYSLLSDWAQRSDDDVLLVLEDDVIIDLGFISQLDLIRELVDQFGYIRLNGQLHAPAKTIKIIDRHRVIRFTRKVHGTLAYLINARTARALLPNLNKVYRPIDTQLDRYWEHGVPINCIYPFVAIERAVASQLGPRSYTKLKGLQLLNWKIQNQIDKIQSLIAGFMA